MKDNLKTVYEENLEKMQQEYHTEVQQLKDSLNESHSNQIKQLESVMEARHNVTEQENALEFANQIEALQADLVASNHSLKEEIDRKDDVISSLQKQEEEHSHKLTASVEKGLQTEETIDKISSLQVKYIILHTYEIV